MAYSYATDRKIRIITEKLGEDWATRCAGESIDAVYTRVTGDDRKNLFCKIPATTKYQLAAMSKVHRVTIAEFVEQMINAEWTRYQRRIAAGEQQMLDEFGGGRD